MDEIKSVVRDYILREFLPGEEPGELTDRTPLITGGILDSISTLKLVVFLEEQFGRRRRGPTRPGSTTSTASARSPS